MCVIVRRIFRINHDVAIVVGRSRIITPNVCIGDLMIRIVGAGRQLCVISEDLPDRENSCGCTTVSLFFVQPWLVLTCDPCSPRKTILAEQYGKWSGRNVPVAAARPLKQSQFTAHRIPRRCKPRTLLPAPPVTFRRASSLAGQLSQPKAMRSAR